MAGDASTVVPCPDSKSITSSIAASKAMTLIATSSPCALTATEQFTVDSRRSFYSVARTDHGKVAHPAYSSCLRCRNIEPRYVFEAGSTSQGLRQLPLGTCPFP